MNDPRRLSAPPPPGWRTRRAKFLFSNERRVGYPNEAPLSASQRFGVVPQFFLEAETDSRVMAAFKGQENFKLVEPDDFVISLRSFQGGIEHSAHRGIISPAYTVMRSAESVYPGFFRHYLKDVGFISRLNAVITGIRDGKTIKYEEFGELDVPLPPLRTQKAIAAFLDRKTVAIDALIEKKQKLLDVLAEKRAALINQAVTKGLDLNVPMRSLTDGAGFFSEMPAAWTFLRLKFLVRDVKDGPHYSPPYVERDDGGHLFLSARNVKLDGWSFDDAKYVSEDLFREFCRRTRPERGDVLYTKGGTTGVARAVDFDEPFQVWVHIAVLKVVRERVNPFYLAYALNSHGCYAQSQLFTRGATNNDLGLTRMINIELPWPALDEQDSIVAWLDARLSTVDATRRRVEGQLDRLQEYRQALITAAVTGQLDIGEDSA